MNEITIDAYDGLKLSCIYSKAKSPIGCVQIIHGMVEHKERYLYFIEKLNEAGYTVIISDLRGHGKSINDVYVLGHIGEIDELVDDQVRITEYIKKKNPDLPLYMFAHSMGSLIARSYLEEHDAEIKKLILSGTVAKNPAVGIAKIFSWSKKLGNGSTKSSDLLWRFSNNNSKDESLDWLSYNEENIKEYMNDPLCSFRFDNASYHTLFKMVKNLSKRKRYLCFNPLLKIRSISGEDDRTTRGTDGIKTSMKYLFMAGYQKLSFIEYPKMRHEVLNEDKKDDVIKDIIEFYGEE